MLRGWLRAGAAAQATRHVRPVVWPRQPAGLKNISRDRGPERPPCIPPYALAHATIGTRGMPASAEERGKWRLPRSAHRFNEPSAGDAPSSIEHISDWPSGGYARGEGGPCSLLRAEARVCGTVLEARTRRALRPGEELAWCYGGGYTRHYRASAECTRRRGGTRMREQSTRETEELL